MILVSRLFFVDEWSAGASLGTGQLEARVSTVIPRSRAAAHFPLLNAKAVSSADPE